VPRTWLQTHSSRSLTASHSQCSLYAFSSSNSLRQTACSMFSHMMVATRECHIPGIRVGPSYGIVVGKAVL